MMILFRRLFLIWFILLSVLPCTDDIIASIESIHTQVFTELSFNTESHQHKDHNHDSACNCHATCSPICSCTGVHITYPNNAVVECCCQSNCISSDFQVSNYSLVHIYAVWNPPQLI